MPNSYSITSCRKEPQRNRSGLLCERFYMEKTISLSSLKARGWTKTMIDSLLPEPELVPNPYFKSSTMRVWNMNDVLAAEETDSFKNFQNAVQEYTKIVNKVPNKIHITNPALDYPNARQIKRHFILNIGATNTGKTYTALQAFKQAKSGVYLAPLRLLAMEIQDRMLEDGIPCSMVTGEEENIVPNACLMSSTVEKIDLSQRYEVGIIDECQMIADQERGGSWTRAILGLAADTIYLCMSPDAEDICIKLIEMCGDTYEVNVCERKIPLNYTGIIPPRSLQRHDAVILFTRKDVLRYAEELKSKGLKSSVVYGALPYKARKRQVEMYNNGETDIIVSTDAIGMGMNLPIKRVIFADIKKFDGKEVRLLKPSEVKQIGGRAGRYGMFEKGEVGMINNFGGCNVIADGLSTPNNKIKKAYIPFPDELIKESDDKVSKVMAEWNQIKYPRMFKHQVMKFTIKKVMYLEKKYPTMDKQLIVKLANIMFDEKKETLFALWASYIRMYLNGETIPLPPVYGKYLQEFELMYEELDMYYSFHKTLGLPFNNEMLMMAKEEVVENINKLLVATNSKKKTNKYCVACGRKIGKDSQYDTCEHCHKKIQKRKRRGRHY